MPGGIFFWILAGGLGQARGQAKEKRRRMRETEKTALDDGLDVMAAFSLRNLKNRPG